MTGGARIGGPGSGVVTPGQVAEARKDLGRQLAAWRESAGLTQTTLARRIAYSRSSVANVEIGRHSITRMFWERADREVGAARALLAAFDHLDGLVQALQVQAARARDQRQATHAPDGCGCGLIVGRWTGRETQALREALRMSVRAFAEHLGVGPSAVSGWEHRSTPAPPSLATQAVLDQALKLADVDARSRFVLLLGDAPHGACDIDTGVAGSSTVTPLRRSQRTRTAS